MRTDILEKRQDIEKWIKENKSKAYIANQLNCKQETLCKYLVKMGIDYAGNQSGKGEHKKMPYLSLVEYLKKSKDIQTNKIRKKLLAEGIKEYKCECCGLTEWNGLPIPLEVHHKDGDKTNNTISNFALICPNCHAQTDSYRGKNSAKK